MQLARTLWSLVSLIVMLAIVAAIGSLAPTIVTRVMTEAFIRLVMVVGLYLFVGNSGVLSFGHAAFMMTGAYASAWLDIPVKTKKIFLKGLPAFLGPGRGKPRAETAAADFGAATPPVRGPGVDHRRDRVRRDARFAQAMGDADRSPPPVGMINDEVLGIAAVVDEALLA